MTGPAPAFATHPVTPDRWSDLEAVFGAKGCSMARGCWCMYYRESGTVEPPEGMSGSEDRRRRLRALVEVDPPPGLVGYRDGVPVWSIVCFVVPPAHRHQGVATALLHGAIEFARDRGAPALEAYPIDKAVPGADAWLWNGAMSMYVNSGRVAPLGR